MDEPSMPANNGHSLDYYVKELRDSLCERFEHGPDGLLGYCHRNAPTLAEWLILCGFGSVSVVKGGLDRPGEPTPEYVSEAHELGLIHYWVEVVGPGDNVWTCDLASESAKHTPDYICLPKAPDSYIRFEHVLDPPAPYNVPEIRV